MSNKVCVAMSGGVDSTAAVILLQQQGYEVFGLTMNLLGEEIADAAKVAKKLGIEHHFIDYTKEFDEYVIKYFKETYLQGLTPSPCIMCNKYIKLGLLVEEAKKRGASKIVTGHYAKLVDGHLYEACNKKKDQSYFLCMVDKDRLSMISFPLEGFTKDETREIVKKAGIDIYSKPDSQDICFIPNGRYSQMFENTLEGNIVDCSGNIVGKHKGIINHTVGQRKGLGIGGFEEPQYVVAINANKNEVVIGNKENLKTTEVLVRELNFLENVEKSFECMVKLRSKQDKAPARVELQNDGSALIHLKEPQFGIAKGQVCCFYDKELVLGGGIIC